MIRDESGRLSTKAEMQTAQSVPTLFMKKKL